MINPTDRQRPLAAPPVPADSGPDTPSSDTPSGLPVPPWRDAGQALSAALTTAGATQGALAILLEVTRPAVSQWVAGTARPTWVNALLLETILGVPALSWLSEAEVSFINRVIGKVTPHE